MILVYSDIISERLAYTLKIVFEDREVSFELTDDWTRYEDFSGPKLSYGKEENCLIKASNILFENTIQNQNIDKTTWETQEILSFDGNPDVLASIFYIVSLYDDYLQTEFDEHGRNIGKESLLYKFNWLQELKVEHWVNALISFIEKMNNCSLNAKEIPFKIVPTFDIDHAYAHKYKGSRNVLSIGKDIIKGNKERLAERREVLSGKKQDPYDTFDWIKTDVAAKFETKVFWLLGDYKGYDTNLSYKNKQQQALIRDIGTVGELGLHPSYASNDSLEQLKKEKNRIENILGKEVSITRQHFLKVHLPTTFERLEQAGFKEDYSLGYADQVGFRAGVSRPFYWFNLKENKTSNLLLHPITYMDGTLQQYMKLSVEEALEIVQKLKKEVQTYGGEFIPLWHNETVGDYGQWKGWKKILEKSLD